MANRADKDDDGMELPHRSEASSKEQYVVKCRSRQLGWDLGKYLAGDKRLGNWQTVSRHQTKEDALLSFNELQLRSPNGCYAIFYQGQIVKES